MADTKQRYATGGKSGKSSKTAHVLDLLTEAESESTFDSSNTSITERPAPNRTSDEEVANQIRNALAQEVDAAFSQEAVPVKYQEESAEGAVQEPCDESPAGSIEDPMGAPSAPDQTPSNIQAGDAEDAKKDMEQQRFVLPSVVHSNALENFSYINVMQALVEEKVDKYIALFGLCSCPKCKIDVMALALTNLPAKYIVTRKNNSIPMLTVYEGRYNAEVISQVMWACKKVLDNPRH